VGAVTAIGAVPDIQDFRSAISQIGETTAEFTAPIEMVTGRGLNIRHDETAKEGTSEESDLKTLFHEHGLVTQIEEAMASGKIRFCEKLLGDEPGNTQEILIFKLLLAMSGRCVFFAAQN
jgi:hypothetical protein